MTPFKGLHMVVTRAAHQAEDLARPLRELGARVTVLPTIGIAPPLDPKPLQKAAATLGAFDWVVFTSANAVHAFAACLPPDAGRRPRTAAIGPATQEAATAAGFHVEVTGEAYVAESLVEAMGRDALSGQRILIPSAAVTRDVVPVELRKRGAEVTVVEAYRNICPPETAAAAAKLFSPPLPDWILFASPSAFQNLLPLIQPAILNHIQIASIGPATSAAITGKGHQVTVEANLQTIPGLVIAILQFVSPVSPAF